LEYFLPLLVNALLLHIHTRREQANIKYDKPRLLSSPRSGGDLVVCVVLLFLPLESFIFPLEFFEKSAVVSCAWILDLFRDNEEGKEKVRKTPATFSFL